MSPLPNSAPHSRFPLKYNPWVYFSIFGVVNSLLAYSPLGLEAKLFIFIFGLAIPLAVAWDAPSASPPAALHEKEFFNPIPWWFWLVIFGAALFSRFAQLFLWAPWLVQR